MYQSALVALFAVAGLMAAPHPKELAHLLQVAEQRSSKPGYWSAQISNTTEQCGEAYWDNLVLHFSRDIIGSQDSGMVDMFDLLRNSKLAYCAERFANSSMKIVQNCRRATGCEGLTESYSLVRRGFDSGAAEILADGMLMNSTVKITSPEEFILKAYTKQGPCKNVFDTLDEPDMDDYRHYFVTLVTQPNYYKYFSGTNVRAADIVAACRDMQSDNTLLRDAYAIYDLRYSVTSSQSR